MQALFHEISDANVVVSMQPEELAGILIRLLKGQDGINTYNLENELYNPGSSGTYPIGRIGEVGQCLREAFAWLTAQGLLVPAPRQSNPNWVVLSRRANGFESTQDFKAYRQARLMNKETLHPTISESCWQAFVRGEYDVAVFVAMKAVEIAVREASGFADQIGVKLMRSAFHPNTGPLRDEAVEEGERDARMNLFVGAIGSYKNPQSHRDVNLEDPQEALEIIMLANHLLRIVDVRRAG